MSKIVTANKLNRLWQNGVVPIKNDLSTAKNNISTLSSSVTSIGDRIEVLEGQEALGATDIILNVVYLDDGTKHRIRNITSATVKFIYVADSSAIISRSIAVRDIPGSDNPDALKIELSKLGEWEVYIDNYYIETLNIDTYGTHEIFLGFNPLTWLKKGRVNNDNLLNKTKLFLCQIESNDFGSFISYMSNGNALSYGLNPIVIRQLFTVHESCDYFASWLNYSYNRQGPYNDIGRFIATDLNCGSFLKWIGLRDYACDKIMSYSGIFDKLFQPFNSSIVNPILLNASTPKMTSNTAPQGEVKVFTMPVGGSWGYQSDGYKLFSYGNTTPIQLIMPTSNPETFKNFSHVEYDFEKPTKVNLIELLFTNPQDASTSVIVDYMDIYTSSWKEYGTYKFDNVDNTMKKVIINNHNVYAFNWRIYIVPTNGADFSITRSLLRVYMSGRSLDIMTPKMTSNTAPEGTVIRSSYNFLASTANGDAWKLFTRTIPATGSNANVWYSLVKYTADMDETEKQWAGYDFGKPTMVKACRVYGNYQTSMRIKDFTIQGTNDYDTWTDLATGTVTNTSGAYAYVSWDSDTCYRAYRVLIDSVYTEGYQASLRQIEFYGADYSEKEFGEDSNVTYIYDNGLKLLPISASNPDSKYGTVTEQVVSLKVTTTGTAVASGHYIPSFTVNQPIDVSKYNFLKIKYGDELKIGSSTARYAMLQLAKANPQCNNTGTLASVNLTDVITSLDISEINDICYPSLASTGQTATCTIREMWLE